MIYELDWKRRHKHGNVTIIAVLTGLPDEEIEAVAPLGRSGWYARDFIGVFRSLGFNCNPRFIKFDRQTPYPCILRFTDVTQDGSGWHAWIYYDGYVYTLDGKRFAFDALDWTGLKITSMLQVWL